MIKKVLCCAAISVLGGAIDSFGQTNKNLAYDRPAPTIPARLTEQSRKMEQRVYRVGDNIYSAMGYGLANSIMAVGSDGIIIIDTTESVESGKAALSEFRKITDRPVKVIIHPQPLRSHQRRAAELLTYVIRVNRDDASPRKLKAAALRQLAYRTENTNWRDWYISSARELEKSLNPMVMSAAMSGLASPDMLKALPVVKFFESMSVRLDPVKSADAHIVVGFRFTDSGKGYAVEIRREWLKSTSRCRPTPTSRSS